MVKRAQRRVQGSNLGFITMISEILSPNVTQVLSAVIAAATPEGHLG